jgi:hypothetical protein
MVKKCLLYLLSRIGLVLDFIAQTFDSFGAPAPPRLVYRPPHMKRTGLYLKTGKYYKKIKLK